LKTRKITREFAGKIGKSAGKVDKMAKTLLKLTSLAAIILFLMLIASPERAKAQWPPFSFSLTPAYESGKIKYNIRFFSRVEWDLGNVVFKISLPEGTRFLEANVQPPLTATFDGSEITFFTSDYYQPIRDASFIVEIVDPAKTIFTTHAWIAWQGEQPGDYLTQAVSIDITLPPLNWEAPPIPRLQLKANATVADGVITYYIYPVNISWMRMWDVRINIPLPPGTSFLSAETTSPFVAGFDGREVSFFATELAQQVEIAPLRFKVSTKGVTAPFAVTHIWASWKNAGWNVGRGIPLEEEIRSGDIVAQPFAAQQVVSDIIGNVPFANYDLTSVAMQNDGSSLKITLYTAGQLGPVGGPFQFFLYIDKDCRVETGQQKNNFGRDYLIVYRHDKGRANFNVWNETENRWDWIQPIDFDNTSNEKMVTMWVPHSLLENSQQFCWQLEAKYTADTYNPNPPPEITFVERYEAAATTSAPAVNVDTTGASISVWGYQVRPSNEGNVSFLVPSTANIGGQLAIPLDNGRALYNVHIFSMPDGHELWEIPNARQPSFRFDGQRLLVNHEGDGVENVFEHNLLDNTIRQVGDGPQDSHPYYDPGGNRVVFDNPELIIGANGARNSFIFVQCGLIPPHLETEPRCRDFVSLGVLIPAGQMGEIQGTHPVWASTDMIAYKGCNTWAGARLCGIYIVPSTSTKGFSDGFIPRQLTSDTSDIPSDTKGNFIAFTSYRDGNWEAYVMDLNGDDVKNLSNSPDSNDGLPAISPDGHWVAFVSDRDGHWAVWAAPITGGDVQKLFDLPTDYPWGDGARNWTNERISWGP
jgi:hypothetical protein